MKRIILFAFTAIFLTACHTDILNSIKDLEDKYDNLDGRVTRLEELCKEMNTNITALQTLVNASQGGDYITAVTPITKDGIEIGYVITFKTHTPITIYHGQYGKDGQDGSGTAAPAIGVKKDTDGIYYWTLNGEWLLGDEGEKIPVSGKDGKDGTNGTNGKNGTNGITPQLKIENDYWYVSTDNGATWTQLSKATGDKGDTGDSMFISVNQDDDYVYFTLANGTFIKIAKKSSDSSNSEKVQIIDGAIMAEFSVSETNKVYFSMGNLMYDTIGSHLCADGTYQNGTWSFAENIWDCDNFLYGRSGYNDKSYYNDADYYPDFITKTSCDITNTYYDWGKYNAIDNGGGKPGIFRMLTRQEWEYLLFNRPNATLLRRAIVLVYKKHVAIIGGRIS